MSVCVCMLSLFSRVQLFATLWTVARQAPLSVGFSRQEYWSGLSCLPAGYLSDPGVKPKSLTSPALASGFFTTSASPKGMEAQGTRGLSAYNNAELAGLLGAPNQLSLTHSLTHSSVTLSTSWVLTTCRTLFKALDIPSSLHPDETDGCCRFPQWTDTSERWKDSPVSHT